MSDSSSKIKAANGKHVKKDEVMINFEKKMIETDRVIINRNNVPKVSKTCNEITFGFGDLLSEDIGNKIKMSLDKSPADHPRNITFLQCDKSKDKSNSDIRKFKCHFCDKDYREKSNLNKHLLKHSTDPSFVCPVCEKKFTEKTNLNKHLVIHTGRRDYVCNVCNLAYVRKSHLDRHFKVHLGDKNFCCPTCDKKFMYKANLKKHFKIHNREEMFLCKICDKNFKSNEILTNHIKIHFDIKNFVCNLCDKKFIQKIHLTDHMKKNHLNENKEDL